MFHRNSRSWQSQCLFSVLCVALLTSTLGASLLTQYRSGDDDLDVYQVAEDDCSICSADNDNFYDNDHIVDTIYACLRCIERNESESADGQVSKRTSYMTNRRSRNTGCGCCVISRFTNTFCCNVCYAKRNV